MSSIDVAVPCYQYGRYLRDCISSIQNQDVPNLRILIIDNASTDDSVEIAKKLSSEDPRIEVIAHTSNRGQKFSYDEAIAWATADYFMILDADDILADGALKRAIDILESDKTIGFCHGAELRTAFAAGRVPAAQTESINIDWTIEAGRDFIARLCEQPVNPVGTSTVVIRTEVQKQAGYYNPNLTHADDVEMWLRLALLGKVAETKSIQAVRRIHSTQLSRCFDGSLVRDCEERTAAYRAFFGGVGATLQNAQKLLAKAERSLSARAYWSGLSHMLRGQRESSVALLKFAIYHRPMMTIFPPFDWLIRMDGAGERIRHVLGLTSQSRGKLKIGTRLD